MRLSSISISFLFLLLKSYCYVTVILLSTTNPIYSQSTFKLQVIKNPETNKYYLADELGKRLSDKEWKYMSSTPNVNTTIDDKVLSDKSLNITVSDGKKKFYVDLAEEYLAPYKEIEKQYKIAYELALERAQNGNYDRIYQQLVEAHLKKTAADAQTAKRLKEQAERNAREKEARRPIPKQKNGLWGFYEKEYGGEIIPAIYQDLVQLGSCYLVSKNGNTYQILNSDIKTFKTKQEYEISTLPFDCYTLYANEKYGVIDSKGSIRIDCKYDDLIPVGIKGKLYFYLISNNKWGWGSLEKGLLQSCIYDYIGDFQYGEADFIYEGYKGTMQLDGTVKKGIVKNLFNLAYDEYSGYSLGERIAIYKKVIELDERFNEGYSSVCYNNIGALYEDAGDVDTAFSYYEKAKNMGSEVGRKNYRRIRTDRVLEGLQTVANALSNTAATLSGNSTVNEQNYNVGNVYYNNSLSNGGENSSTYYQTQYANWERRAKANYESLTTLGYRYQKQNGEKGGNTSQSMSGNNYVRQKQYLREAQNEMKKIRNQASKNGITIAQSTYETVTVSY